VEKIIVTAGHLAEAKEAAALTQENERLFFTVGVHPTRCGVFEQQNKQSSEESQGGSDNVGDTAGAYLRALKEVAEGAKGKVVAVGEFGLDYDRINFCPKVRLNIEMESVVIPSFFSKSNCDTLSFNLILPKRRACHCSFTCDRHALTLWKSCGGIGIALQMELSTRSRDLWRILKRYWHSIFTLVFIHLYWLCVEWIAKTSS
jgi:hypothetical protein